MRESLQFAEYRFLLDTSFHITCYTRYFVVSIERNNCPTIDAKIFTNTVSLGRIFNYWDMWWDRPMTNLKEPVQDIISSANSFKQDSWHPKGTQDKHLAPRSSKLPTITFLERHLLYFTFFLVKFVCLLG